MAVRMLTYSGLLYQRLVGEGVLRERGALPPVLPVVIYNGRSPWTASADVAELIAAGGATLARYQPSQQSFLLDEGRVDGGALPPGNLVSALIALETNRDRSRLPALLDTLIELLQAQDDKELTDAFRAWAAQVLLPRRLRGDVLGAAAEAGGGAHDAGGNRAGVDRAVGRAGDRARARTRDRAVLASSRK